MKVARYMVSRRCGGFLILVIGYELMHKWLQSHIVEQENKVVARVSAKTGAKAREEKLTTGMVGVGCRRVVSVYLREGVRSTCVDSFSSEFPFRRRRTFVSSSLDGVSQSAMACKTTTIA